MLPQFSFRLLLIMVASCGIAMAIIVRSPHAYITWVASCVPVFWGGMLFVLIGAAVELRGDRWLLLGVCTGILGALVCVISVFTGVFYFGTYVGRVWLFG